MMGDILLNMFTNSYTYGYNVTLNTKCIVKLIIFLFLFQVPFSEQYLAAIQFKNFILDFFLKNLFFVSNRDFSVFIPNLIENPYI